MDLVIDKDYLRTNLIEVMRDYLDHLIYEEDLVNRQVQLSGYKSLFRSIEDTPKVQVSKFAYMQDLSGDGHLEVIKNSFAFRQVINLVISSCLNYLNYDPE